MTGKKKSYNSDWTGAPRYPITRKQWQEEAYFWRNEAKRFEETILVREAESRSTNEPTLVQIERAIKFVREKPSTSYLQRKMYIGYTHACQIMKILETVGFISPADAAGRRTLLSEVE